ncbi:MAG: zf-TFIIB domain-containing protein [Deltaproteobacteria bacterium]|nr:zf-TFIIB domain-containing protein [Deltaproteobacteria bacterium]
MTAYRDVPEEIDVPRCPCCAHERLDPTPLADAEVLACAACLGVFVPTQVLTRFADARDPVAARSLDEPRVPLRAWLAQRRLACPTCRKPMEERPFAQGIALLVDECATHGIWFDGGELREAASFVASGAEPPAQARATPASGGSPNRVLGAIENLVEVFSFWKFL